MRVARGRGGWIVRGDGRHVGEERSTLRSAGANECICLPAQYIGLVVAIFCTEVSYGALVVYVVVEVVGVAGRESCEPSIPPPGHEGGVRVAIQVLAEESGPVASVLQACGHVVFLVSIVLVGLPTTDGGGGAVCGGVGPDAGVVGVLAPHD
jgi:hypothetical protein